MMLGAWYGVWLGLYWYRKVYEEQSHGGLIDHISTHYFPRPRPQETVADLKQRLTADLSQLETITREDLPDISAITPVVAPAPIRRKIVRKRAPKKLKTAKASPVE